MMRRLFIAALTFLTSLGCAKTVGERTRADLRTGPPDFILDTGIQVYLYGQESSDFRPPFLDGAVSLFIEEFGYRYNGYIAYDKIMVHFVPYDRWLHKGTLVEGLAYHDHLLVVGAGNWRLWRTAFVHEMVHGTDVLVTGTSDGTHDSWEGAVNDSIDRVNWAIRLRTR